MAPRRMAELDRRESLRLLGTAGFGRIVFTRQAMPAIRPVNHVVDDGAIIIRTHLGAAVLSAVGLVVAYEADDIDPVHHVGWTVIVTGIASPVRGADEIARYEQQLQPWVHRDLNQVIRIRPELVTGYRISPMP